jgi:hypothetical protein
MNLLRLFASSVLVTGLCGIAVACSSTDAGTTPEGACSTYADAYRSYTQKCAAESSVSISDTRWPQLQDRMKAACTSALTLPGTAITPAALTVCANAIRGASCNTDSDDLPQCDFDKGTLADGAACTTGNQCQSGSCKKTATETGSTGCGVCQPRIAIGGDCSTDNSTCVTDARCDFTTKKCVAVVRNGVGGSCDSAKGESCLSGLYCDFTTKICKERGAAGATCSSSAPCQTGLQCSATTKTCTAPTLAAEGQACGGTTGVGCVSGLRCDFTAQKCVKITWVAPGGDCSVVGSMCEHGACNTTTKKCPVLIADGAACTSDRSTGVCNDFASCIDGKCLLPGQVVCK